MLDAWELIPELLDELMPSIAGLADVQYNHRAYHGAPCTTRESYPFP